MVIVSEGSRGLPIGNRHISAKELLENLGQTRAFPKFLDNGAVTAIEL